MNEYLQGIQEEIRDLHRKLPTKRELLAGMALQGLLAAAKTHDTTHDRLAHAAVMAADALLAALAAGGAP